MTYLATELPDGLESRLGDFALKRRLAWDLVHFLVFQRSQEAQRYGFERKIEFMTSCQTVEQFVVRAPSECQTTVW